MLAHFLVATPYLFYPVFILSIVVFIHTIKLKYYIGPTILSSIYFLFPLTWSLFFVDFYDFLLLILLMLFFIYFYKLGTIRKTTRILTPPKQQRYSSKILFIIIISYLLLILYAFNVYGDNNSIDKLAWTTSAGVMPYFISAYELTLLALLLHCIDIKNKKIFIYIVLALVFGGLLFGTKGILINILLLLLVNPSTHTINYLKLILKNITYVSLIIFATILIFFGDTFESAYLAFIDRLLATIDGTFTILTTDMYHGFVLPNPVIYYFFDFLTSRIYGVTPSLGQMIANNSIILSYPEFGGPNDSIINYFLLSGILDKISIIIFVGFFSFISGSLERKIKNGQLEKSKISKKIVYYSLYISMPMFFQATGTAFLIMTRAYIIIIPTILIMYFIRKAIKS